MLFTYLRELYECKTEKKRKEQIKWARLSISMLLELGRLTQQNLAFRGILDCIFNPRSVWATQGVIVLARLLGVILSQKKQNRVVKGHKARSTSSTPLFHPTAIVAWSSLPSTSVTSLLSLTSKHWPNQFREWVRLWSSKTQPWQRKEAGLSSEALKEVMNMFKEISPFLWKPLTGAHTVNQPEEEVAKLWGIFGTCFETARIFKNQIIELVRKLFWVLGDLTQYNFLMAPSFYLQSSWLCLTF